MFSARDCSGWKRLIYLRSDEGHCVVLLLDGTNAEVGHLALQFRIHQQILWFEVSVDNGRIEMVQVAHASSGINHELQAKAVVQVC